MSAPHIPNLNTLRRGAGRGRSRGRGDLGSSHESSDEDKRAAADKIVQSTDQDASVSRLSAVEAGYLNDPFAKAFVTGEIQRRLPIMNRGTYVRTTVIDSLVNRFLSSQPTRKKQIISLGAGSDTRFFRLMSTKPDLQIVCHEFDFPANTAAKITSVLSSPLLRSQISISSRDQDANSDDPGSTLHISPSGDALHSPSYHILPIDLRDFSDGMRPDSGGISPALLSYISPSLPTLILSEMCLCYLPVSLASSTLHSLLSLIPSPTPVGIIIYEPINPHTPFGTTMTRNLSQRGITLPTLSAYPDLSSQRERLRDHGFSTRQDAAEMEFVWEKWVSEEEKGRVAGLPGEWVDEVEEWQLLMRCYCLVWGWREEEKGKGEGKGMFAEAWKGVEGQQ